jgi:hypothetical protein
MNIKPLLLHDNSIPKWEHHTLWGRAVTWKKRKTKNISVLAYNGRYAKRASQRDHIESLYHHKMFAVIFFSDWVILDWLDHSGGLIKCVCRVLRTVDYSTEVGTFVLLELSAYSLLKWNNIYSDVWKPKLSCPLQGLLERTKVTCRWRYGRRHVSAIRFRKSAYF